MGANSDSPSKSAIVIVSNDPRAAAMMNEAWALTAQPPIRILRSEQMLFGLGRPAQVFIRDLSTVSDVLPLPTVGTEMKDAADLVHACAIAASVSDLVSAPHDSGFVSAQQDAGFVSARRDTDLVSTRRDTGFVSAPHDARFVSAPHDAGFVSVARDAAMTVGLRDTTTQVNERCDRPPLVVIANSQGGVGASTCAWLWARHFVDAYGSCALIDADERSPGLDLWTCDETTPGARWSSLATLSASVDAQRLWQCLVHVEPHLRLLSQGRTLSAISQSTARAVLDALATRPVVIDVSSSRHGGVVSESLSRATMVVLVSAMTVAGCAASRGEIARIREVMRGQAQLIVALRHQHPGVSALAAQEMLGVPTFLLPEGTHVARQLRRKQTHRLVNKRWQEFFQQADVTGTTFVGAIATTRLSRVDRLRTFATLPARMQPFRSH